MGVRFSQRKPIIECHLDVKINWYRVVCGMMQVPSVLQLQSKSCRVSHETGDICRNEEPNNVIGVKFNSLVAAQRIEPFVAITEYAIAEPQM